MWASASEGQAQARMAAHTRGMKDWAGHFGLVELRKTSGHGACENPNGYAYLTAEVAMPLERYVALPPWEAGDGAGGGGGADAGHGGGRGDGGRAAVGD